MALSLFPMPTSTRQYLKKSKHSIQAGSMTPGGLRPDSAQHPQPSHLMSNPFSSQAGTENSVSSSCLPPAAGVQQEPMDTVPPSYPPSLNNAKFRFMFPAFLRSQGIMIDPDLPPLDDKYIKLAILHALVISTGGFQKVNGNEAWNANDGGVGFTQHGEPGGSPPQSSLTVAQYLAYIYHQNLSRLTHTHDWGIHPQERAGSPRLQQGYISYSGTISIRLSANDWFRWMRSSAQMRCRSLIFQILGDRDQRAQIKKLLGEDAQVIVDYLDIVCFDAGIFEAPEQRCDLSLLGKLAKAAGVFPKCYELKGVYHDLQPVSGGGFADVYKGEYCGEAVCLKVVRMFQKQEVEKILTATIQELTVWAHLQHKNIQPFYGTCYPDDMMPRVGLVSPWMKNGNLRDYLDKFPQMPRMPFISDVIEGLQYLHGSHIIHFDLKAQNVLISDDGYALITDFGLSSVIATTSNMLSQGTSRFMAPEIVVEESQSTASSDIWSFACLCYETLTDKWPFYQYKDIRVVRALMDKEVPTRPEQEPDANCKELDDRVWELLLRCWNYTPQDRPSCEAIRDAIGNMRIQDNQPQIKEKIRGSSFQQNMREKSNSQLDYARVENILLCI